MFDEEFSFGQEDAEAGIGHKYLEFVSNKTSLWRTQNTIRKNISTAT